MKTQLVCCDFAATRAFYEEILERPCLEAWDHAEDRGCILEGGLDGGLLELMERGDASVTSEQDAVTLQIRVASLEGWLERTGRADQRDAIVTRRWGQRYFWLHDPEGRRVAIYERSAE